MSSFWESVRDRLDMDGPVFIALVVDHSVHSPGTTGARMAVFPDGSLLGTIGGGVMEVNIVQSGLRAIETDVYTTRIQKLVHRSDGEGEKSGLICAGFQTNLYALLRREDHLDVLNSVVAAQQADEPAVLKIDEAEVKLTAASKGPLKQHHLEQTDDSWSYAETVLNLSRVAILGGGHCGLALSRLMHRLGYYVSIFDTRPRVPTMLENDFTDEKHIVEDFVEAGPLIRFPAHTSVVVMTTELSSDIRALLGLTEKTFRFMGVMGSRAKIVAIRKALERDGAASEFIDRIAAPVGLPIGSNTPDEIAVSVAAQLLQLRPDMAKPVRS